ncbi:MAG: hypothetical protein ACRDJ4_02910 [Actinomycetota bacterium]
MKQRYPHIHAGMHRRLWSDPEFRGFNAYVSFMFGDPASADEDLLLSFDCRESQRGFRNPDGTLRFPEGVRRDAVGFEIARGTGETVAALEPLLLPPDRDSPEYEEAVLRYVSEAVRFMDEHLALIVDALQPPGQD